MWAEGYANSDVSKEILRQGNGLIDEQVSA